MSFSPSRLLLPLSIVVLAGCAGQQKPVVTLDDADDCSPLKLTQGQELVLTLPSNPTTGFRWELRNPAASVLKRLGPEVYSNSEEDSGLVGSGGESTWRFRVAASGDDRLELVYRRPWEKDAEPAESFSCAIQALKPLPAADTFCTKTDVLRRGDLAYPDRPRRPEDSMLRAAFVLLALSCAAPLPSLAEPLRFAGDDGCPYLCPGTPQRPGYLVEALSQVLREPPHFDSLPWPRAVQMVRDGHRDGLVGAYGLDGLRVGSEPIGWVGLAFYTRHDSDWRYSGDASLLGQRLGLAQGYVNNPRFEAWRSQAGDDDLHLQVLGGERVLPRNLQKLLLGRIDVLLEDRDIIEHYLEHHPQLAGQVRRAGELPGRQPLHVGLSPHLPEVDARLAELDEGLRQLRREGTLKVLGERYRLSFE